MTTQYRNGCPILSDDERFLYEERAAIKQFDGKMPRAEAERQALEELRKREQEENR